MRDQNLPQCHRCGGQVGLYHPGDDKWWCPTCLWAEVERLRAIVEIGYELAGHVTRPVALGMPFDRDVLRHWANQFLMSNRVEYGVMLVNSDGSESGHSLRWRELSDAATFGETEVREKRACGFRIFSEPAV